MQQYIIIGLVFLFFSLIAYHVSGAFINYFWQDAREEAEMFIADKRSSTEYAKGFNWQCSLIILLLCALFYSLLIQTTNIQLVIFIKVCMFLYFVFIALIDFRTMILPDMLNYIGIWLGLLIACYHLNVFGLTPLNAVTGVVGSYMVCWLILHSGLILLKKQVLGHGDAKYLAMLGAWFGFKVSFLTFFMAVFFLSLFQFFRWLFISTETLFIPFGPSLATVASIMILYYNDIIAYSNKLLTSIF